MDHSRPQCAWHPEMKSTDEPKATKIALAQEVNSRGLHQEFTMLLFPCFVLPSKEEHLYRRTSLQPPCSTPLKLLAAFQQRTLYS